MANAKRSKTKYNDLSNPEWLVYSRVPRGFWNDIENHRRYVRWLEMEWEIKDREQWYEVKTKDLIHCYGVSLLTRYSWQVPKILKAVYPSYPWKEWMFPQVPQGFFAEKKNRVRWIKWAAEQLDLRKPEDWYDVNLSELVQLKSGCFFGNRGLTLVEVLREAYPKTPWKEWLFAVVPNGFWKERHHQQRYMTWLQKQLKFRKMEGWYSVTDQDFRNHRGSGIYHLYGSTIELLKDQFPKYKWLEWKFGHVSEGFWKKRANVFRFRDWFQKQLGIKKLEDWYEVTASDFKRHHGGGVLLKYDSSPSTFVMNVFDEYEWLPWMFRSVPFRFWEKKTNARRYFQWLTEELKIKQLDDWYQITARDITQNYGSRFLQIYGGSVAAVVKRFHPKHRWLPWKFRNTPAHFFKQKENRIQYLRWLERQLGYRRPEDWYQFVTPLYKKHCGKPLMEIYGYAYEGPKELYPEYDWREWQFTKVPRTFWDVKKNRQRYLRWLGQTLSFQRTPDWNRLRRTDFEKHRGGVLFEHRYSLSLDRAIAEAKRLVKSF